MSLPALPQELLLTIFELSLPYTFEDLALTCKSLYHAAAPLLEKHNRARKRYRNWKFGPSTVGSVVELLCEIAVNPVVARYIVHADLGDESVPTDVSDTWPLSALATLIERSEHLAALTSSSSDPQLTTHWYQNIVNFPGYTAWRVGFHYPIAFLLTLLTNVESLALPQGWRGPSHFQEMATRAERLCDVATLIQRLIKHANNAELDDQPLQKLRMLYPTRNIDAQIGVNMDTIFPFLGLDSLREAHHESGIHEPSYEQEMSSYYGPHNFTFGKNLEVLKLRDYVLNEHGANRVFKDMHRLWSLDFEYSKKSVSIFDWHANDFISTLMDHVGSTLERLVLTAGLINDRTQIIQCSLQRFQVLAHLDIDTVFFVNSKGSMGYIAQGGFEDEGEDDFYEVEDDIYGLEDDIYEEEDDVYEEEDDFYESMLGVDIGGKPNRLVDMLPSSLRTLVIRAPATDRDYDCLVRCLFNGFEEEREGRLPLLIDARVHMRVEDFYGHALADAYFWVRKTDRFFGDESFVDFQVEE